MRNSIAPLGIAAFSAMVIAGLTIGCDSPSGPIMNPTEPVVEMTDPPVFGQHATNGGDMNRLIAAARAATAKYHNVEAARAAGYVEDGFGCISDPTMGAMGIHFINLEIDTDPSIDLARPELLLYEPGKDGRLTLVGVEYEVFQADWWAAGNTAPPSLFGHEFAAIIFPGLDPLFGLHVWLWRHNPTGIIQDWNHAVSCP